MKKLHFSVLIQAPRERVWSTMLSDRTYRQWTNSFCQGSYFDGTWNEGDRIRFLSPDGGGMVSVIVANRKYEFISIKHIGYISNGVEDTESEQIRSWAPAFENYTFKSVGTETELLIDQDSTDEYEQYMRERWPMALAKLKQLCEAHPSAGNAA